MKPRALWMLLAFIPAMNASTITCNAGAASIPVFDPSSASGAVGDYTLNCTGGTPVTPPTPIPEIDVDAFINVPVLNTGGWILTDGVNMIPGIMVASNLIEFLGVPFNPPGTGNLAFQVENILVNPSAEPPGFQFKEELEITSNFSINVTSPVQLVAVNAVPEPAYTPVVVGLGLTIWLRRKRSLT